MKYISIRLKRPSAISNNIAIILICIQHTINSGISNSTTCCHLLKIMRTACLGKSMNIFYVWQPAAALMLSNCHWIQNSIVQRSCVNEEKPVKFLKRTHKNEFRTARKCRRICEFSCFWQDKRWQQSWLSTKFPSVSSIQSQSKLSKSKLPTKSTTVSTVWCTTTKRRRSTICTGQLQ